MKKDLSQTALDIVKQATGEKPKTVNKEKDPNAVALGKKGAEKRWKKPN